MSKMRDEILMAYADDLLPSGKRADIERELCANPAALATVLMFRLTGLAVKAAYAALPVDGSPAELLARFGLGKRPARSKVLHGMGLVLPIAACVALAIAFASSASMLWEPQAGPASRAPTALGPVQAGTKLAAALDQLDNSVFAPASAGDMNVVIVESLRDKFGNSCAEANVYEPDAHNRAPAEVLVACKGEDGWSVVGAVNTLSVTRPVERPYAEGEDDAHRALSGVLVMIGSGSKSSASLGESSKP